MAPHNRINHRILYDRQFCITKSTTVTLKNKSSLSSSSSSLAVRSRPNCLYTDLD